MIDFYATLPHPPLIIDKIGGKRREEIKETILNYRLVAEKIKKINPDLIIIISPHAPYYKDAFFISTNKEVSGDLSKFLYNEEITIDIDKEFVNSLLNSNFPFVKDESYRIDHGSYIPIHFIKDAYKEEKLPKFVILGQSLLDKKYYSMLADLINNNLLDRKAVFIASGDMSHCKKEDGPYGFNEAGINYDNKIRYVLEENLNKIDSISDIEVEKGEQCGHRSIYLLKELIKNQEYDKKFLSHEDPFGVSYMISYYKVKNKYVELAKSAIYNYIVNNKVIDHEKFNLKRSCFVTIYKNNKLRGCIGTIYPLREDLKDEIIENAISAATKDPRFDKIEIEELGDLEISVDVLGKIEKVNSLEELDSKKYGVIVSKDFKRGLLLPNIDGVDTYEEQIKIAKRKAGIMDDDFLLDKFEVKRYY